MAPSSLRVRDKLGALRADFAGWGLALALGKPLPNLLLKPPWVVVALICGPSGVWRGCSGSHV